MSHLTSSDPSETKRSVYDTCDPNYLRQLREASGMDWVVLARIACLSVAQVRQLETEGASNLFYSEAIKQQAYKRLLMILGAEPPSVEVPAELLDAGKVAHAHLDTLDQIVAMSQQPPINHSMADTLREWGQTLMHHKQSMASLMFFVLATVLYAFYGPSFSTNTAPALVKAPQDSASVASATAPVAVPVAEPAVLVTPPASVASVASKSEPVASAPLAVTPAAVVTNKSSTCVHNTENLPQVTPFVANKEGRYVYVISTTATEICVVDGQQQATVLQLKAGENRSVYGTSPWQVSSPDLSKIQIYFQGGRVTLPEGVNRVKLMEVPVVR
jgi:hypothetical protein